MRRSSNGWFKGFSCQQAKEVLRYGAWTEVPPGERLLSQDDPTPYLAFIESGEVKLLIKHPSSTSFVSVTSLGEGGVIGWELLVGTPCYTFEVESVTRTRMFAFPTGRLETLREREPGVVGHLL